MPRTPPIDPEDQLRAGPFLAAGLIAFATVVLPPAPDLTEVGAAAALFALICGLGFAFPWARPPRRGGAVLALLYFLVVSLLRDGQGGANAGYAPMMLLPVFWLALYGRRRQLYVAIAGVAAAFFIPLIFIGGTAYSPTELRRGILFTVTSAIVGLTVHSLVSRTRERGRQAATQRDLATAAEAAARAAAMDARASELALRESEERMRSLIDHLPDTVVLIFDRDLRCTLAEGQMLSRPEFEGRELVGAHILDGIDEAEAPTISALYEAALEGETKRFEYVSPNTGFAYETELAPYVQSGEIVGVLSVSRDISTRRRAEAEVAAAHERFVESFESAPIGMALVALDGSVTAANPALGELLGREAGSLVGMKAEDVLENKDPAFIRARYREIGGLGTGAITRYNTDEVYVHADGHTIDVAVSMSLVRDVDGRPSHCITQILDISERKRLQEQLQHQAERDPLTGLYNRREFSRTLRQHVAAVARGRVAGAAILLDIDRFKGINDSYGHASGDHVIVEVGRVIEQSVRGGDLVGRLGGDEFAILLPDADAAAAERVAQRLVADARRYVQAPGAPDGATITLSVGVAVLRSGEPVTADEVLEEADRAMYRAKQAGRDGYALSPARAV